jgi:hypothetical protein
MLPSSSGQKEICPDGLRRRSLNYGGGKKNMHTKGSVKKGREKNARTKDENKKWAPNKAAIRERAGTKYG